MSVRFLTDENFDGNILHGVRLRRPNLDIVRVQDVGLRTASDPTILDWAARERRILLTHDVETMSGYAYDRVRRGDPPAGVFLILGSLPIADAITGILLIEDCSLEGEWEGTGAIPAASAHARHGLTESPSGRPMVASRSRFTSSQRRTIVNSSPSLH